MYTIAIDWRREMPSKRLEGEIFSRTSMHCLAVCVKCKYTQRGTTASWPLLSLSTQPLGWFRSFSLVLFAVEKIKGDGGVEWEGRPLIRKWNCPSVRPDSYRSPPPLPPYINERCVHARTPHPFRPFTWSGETAVCVHSHILYRYILDVFFLFLVLFEPDRRTWLFISHPYRSEDFFFPFILFRSSSLLDIRTPPMCRGNRWWMMALSILVLAIEVRQRAAVPADS